MNNNIDKKFLVTLTAAVAAYFSYMYLFEREFDISVLNTFVMPVIIWTVMKRFETPRVKPLEALTIQGSELTVLGESFTISDIDKVALGVTNSTGHFSMPFNTIDGKTLGFDFDVKYLNEFKTYLTTNIPHLSIIK